VLDNVKDLGDFIEIEAPTKKEFDKIVAQLDLRENNVISGAGYPDLLKRKNATK